VICSALCVGWCRELAPTSQPRRARYVIIVVWCYSWMSSVGCLHIYFFVQKFRLLFSISHSMPMIYV
jgi:hypothetical protein